MPTIVTAEVSSINQNTAVSGGNIISDGNSKITARGVCWSANSNVTINDKKTVDGAGSGNFTSNIVGLVENKKYYVRAYAVNEKGIAYGNTVSFTTAPSDPGTLAFKIDEKDLFPEGIAYDPTSKQLFLSSIRKDKILVVNSLGVQSNFISPKQDEMLHSLGLKVDANRRRLWVISNSDWGSQVISAIHIYDIDSRKLLKRFFTVAGRIPVFNDLVLTSTGSAFISDVEGNSIYQVSADLSNLELFVKSDDLLVGANGLAISPDNSILYAASLSKGIIRIEVKSKTIQQVKNNSIIEANGIDGLLLYNNSLIGIANSSKDLTKHYIARYQLSTDGLSIISASIIDENNSQFQTPTTGFISGDEFYCLAATYLQYFTISGGFDSMAGNPIILKYKLKSTF